MSHVAGIIHDSNNLLGVPISCQRISFDSHKGAFQPKDCATISTMGTEDMCKLLHMKKENKVLNQGCV